MDVYAPAKLILCGEHAVVYGRPAIALPLNDIVARGSVQPGPPGSGLRLRTPNLDREWLVDEAPDDPLSELALATLRQLDLRPFDACVTLTSAIPIASGMGSGAAVATALVRALAAHVGRTLPAATVSALVYGSERRFHGTPSGIDNAVIAFGQPIWYVREVANGAGETRGSIQQLSIAAPFTLLIADSGIRSATHLPVGEVRRRWQAEPARYEDAFDQVGALVAEVRMALAAGAIPSLGPLLDANQALLEQLGVSSPELDKFVVAARSAGALGAKLSGAGWGGIMLALVDQGSRTPVAAALRRAGAAQVLETVVEGNIPLDCS